MKRDETRVQAGPTKLSNPKVGGFDEFGLPLDTTEPDA